MDEDQTILHVIWRGLAPVIGKIFVNACAMTPFTGAPNATESKSDNHIYQRLR